MSIAVAIFGLAFLILIHEAGHFLVALAVRMRPRRFYVFFPPPLVKRVRNGIEYGIGSIPLGGYVKIPGMHRPHPEDVERYFGPAVGERRELAPASAALRQSLEEGDLDAARRELPRFAAAVAEAPLTPGARKAAESGLRELDDTLSPDAYWRAAVWKKVAVIFAGPGTNLVFAVALLAVIFMIGIPVGQTRTVDQVSAETPAAEMGLRSGDVIVAVDGNATPTFAAVRKRIEASAGKPIEVSVLRDGRRVALGPAEPERVERELPGGEVEVRYVLGFTSAPRETERHPPHEAVALAAGETWAVTKAIGQSVGRLVTGSGREEIASPVGIVQVSSEALEVSLRYYLGILALISLSLALLNLLPLLPLDGGHIAFSLIEGIRGRAIPREAYERVSALGIAVVLLLFFIGLTNDIGRLTG